MQKNQYMCGEKIIPWIGRSLNIPLKEVTHQSWEARASFPQVSISLLQYYDIVIDNFLLQ